MIYSILRNKYVVIVTIFLVPIVSYYSYVQENQYKKITPIEDCNPYQIQNKVGVIHTLVYEENKNYSTKNITNVFWRQVFGPVNTYIECPTCYRTKVTGLTVVGTYMYELTVTDSGGLSGKDTTSIQVLSGALPIINIVDLYGIANKYNNKLTIKYGTDNYIESSFIVEKSKDGNSFIRAGEVRSNRTGKTDFIDKDFYATTYYRVYQSDKEIVEYSKIIKVDNVPEIDNMVAYQVGNYLTVSYYSKENQDCYIRVTTVSGSILYSFVKQHLSVGVNRFQYYMKGRASGIYLVTVVTKEQPITHKVFIN